MEQAQDILVLGGSGFIGTRLCEMLVEQCGGAAGSVTVATRHSAHARHLQVLPGAVVEEVDVVQDEAALERLVAERTAVVNLVATLHGDEATLACVHVDLPRRIAQACLNAGVQRLVHVSALGADAAAPSMYLRSKAGGEAAVLRSGVPVSVLRPSAVFGEHDRFLNFFAHLCRWLPVVPLAGADAKLQPVWVDDVARAIVACLGLQPMPTRTYECVGPGVYTLGQIVRLAGRWSGHARPVVPLPPALGSLLAWFTEHLPGAMPLTRDSLASLQVPSVASGNLPGLAELGIRASSLESVAPYDLARVRGTVWRGERLSGGWLA